MPAVIRTESSARPANTPGALGWVRRHPLLVFLVSALVLGWLILAVPVLQAHGRLAGPRIPLPMCVLAVTFGVMIPVALWLTWLQAGRHGVVALLRRCLGWRFNARAWLLLIFGVPGLTLLLGLVVGGTPSLTDPAGLAAAVLSVLSAVLVIHLSEELVWAGFLQSRLSEGHSLVAAAGLTAIPFAALHLPLSLLGEFSVRSVLIDAGGLLLLGLLLRVAIGIALRATAGSVLASAVLHGSFNAANNANSVLDRLLEGADHGLLAAAALALLSLAGLLLVGRGSWRASRRSRWRTGSV